MFKKALGFIALCGSLQAMGFAPMGNVSGSLGGAGVALRNSAWGLYYNPALLSSDPRSKFSYSAGLEVLRGQIDAMLKINAETPANEIPAILDGLKDSRAGLSTQMGVVAQFGGYFTSKTIAVQDAYGRLVSKEVSRQTSAFAIGAFATSNTSLIFTSKGSSRYGVKSLGVALMEIPVGYAYKLETDYGDFNFGAAMKFMASSFDFSMYEGDAYGELELKLPDFLSQKIAYGFGIDLGFLYSWDAWHLGLSAKNINLPSFAIGSKKLRLDPSLRLGLSYEFLSNYNLLIDADLLPQSVEEYFARQMIAFGVMGDYGFLDFRVGVGIDARSPKDSKITLGVNLYGILDVVGELGVIFAQPPNGLIKPASFGFRVGSTFAF